MDAEEKQEAETKAIRDCWQSLVDAMGNEVKRFKTLAQIKNLPENEQWDWGQEDNGYRFRVSRYNGPVVIGKYCILTDRRVSTYTLERAIVFPKDNPSPDKPLYWIKTTSEGEVLTAGLFDDDDSEVAIPQAVRAILFPFLLEAKLEDDPD